MVQLARGVLAVEEKPMTLEEEAVAARPVGAEGTVVQLPVAGARTAIPLMSARSTTEVNTITIWPEALAVAVNVSSIALSSPPAAANISKLVSTAVPLMLTLKTRFPAAVQ